MKLFLTILLTYAAVGLAVFSYGQTFKVNLSPKHLAKVNSVTPELARVWLGCWSAFATRSFLIFTLVGVAYRITRVGSRTSKMNFDKINGGFDTKRTYQIFKRHFF